MYLIGVEITQMSCPFYPSYDLKTVNNFSFCELVDWDYYIVVVETYL